MSIELTMLVCARRAKMMGFNAARLEWNVAGLAASPKSVSTSDCDIATAADIESSLLPPTTTDTPQPTGNPTLPQSPPSITGDTCSADLPTTSTTDRFVYMANYLCGQVCLPTQLACSLAGTAFAPSINMTSCMVPDTAKFVYLMYSPNAVLDSVCMQGAVINACRHQCRNCPESVLCSAAYTPLQCLTLSVPFTFTASASPTALM